MVLGITEKTENEEIRRIIDLAIDNSDAANLLVCGINSAFLTENKDAHEGLMDLMIHVDPSRPREEIMARGLMETFMDAAKNYTPTAQEWLADVVTTTRQKHPSLFTGALRKKTDEFLLQIK